MSSREPLRVFVSKKYLIPSKIIVFLIGGFFLLEIYTTLTTGVAHVRGVTLEKGEHWGYYVDLIKNAAVASFCLWFGIFGIKLKSSADSDQ